MKKIVSFLIIFSLIISAFPVCVSAYGDDTPDVYNEACRLIEKLGILEDVSSVKPVSRAEFITAAVKLFGMDKLEGTDIKNIFTDVSEDDQTYKSVSVAYDMRWISPAADKLFKPENAVRIDEAVKILVCGLNYRDMAEATGGFPGGYTSVANKLKLLKYMECDGAYLSRDDAVLLLYNTLNADYVEVSSVKENDTLTYGNSGKTVLEQYFDLHCVQVQVVSAGITDILGLKDIQPAKAKLKSIDNGQIYNVWDTDGVLTDNVGEQMEVYLKYDAYKNTYNCVAAFPYNQTVEVFDGEDISAVDREKSRFTFYVTTTDENNAVSEEKVKYSYTSGIVVVLNDVYQFDVRPVFDILAQENTEYNIDKLKIIDIDSDGVCDVLSLYAYKNYIADSVDPVWDKVRIRGDMDWIDIDRDMNDVYQADGRDAISEYITLDSILTVYERPVDNEYIKNTIYVSNDYVDGVVEMLDSDTHTVWVSGRELTFDRNAVENFDSISVGKEYRFFKDYKGRVAFAKKISVSNDMEGYFVVEKFVIDNRGMDHKLRMRVFDINHGEVIECEVADKVVINDESYSLSDSSGANTVYNLLDGVNLVYMCFGSDDSIKGIKTPSETEGDFRYATGVKGPMSMTYKSAKKVLYQAVTDTSGAYNILPDLYRTKVVVAPTDGSYSDEERSQVYKNTTTDYFVNDMKYNVEGYVLNEHGIMSDIVIVYVDPDKHSPIVTKTAVFVVDYVTSAINLAGEKGKRVVGYQGGQPRSYISQEAEFKTTSGEYIQLKPGDVFKPQLDVHGDCSGVEMVYSASDKKLTANDAHKYASSARVFKGLVYNVDGNFFSVVADSQLSSLGGDMRGMLNSYSGASYMYYVNTDEKKGKRVRVGTTADMNTYVKSETEDASEVIVMTRYADAGTVIIFD